MSSFLEYYKYCKALGKVKVNFNKAIDNFNVQKAVDKIGEKNKRKSTLIYVVPSVTGNSGILEINGKIFYEV